MTKRRCWRYKCDYCGKTGCGAGAMKSHERGCTANPHRVCRMHRFCEKPQVPVSELVAIMRQCPGMEPPDFGTLPVPDAVREAADNCPVCILAAVRQSGQHGENFAFDYHGALTKFWREVGERRGGE